MKKANIPENHQTVMTHVIVNNADAFISFTQNVFGARLTHKTMRDETIIIHAEIMIGVSTIMFADATGEFKERPATFFVYVENADETFKKALDAGATSLREVGDQPYGRSGGVADPFGNQWWVTSLK